MRTIIELPSDQLQALDRWCRREGISRAEAIRRAVAEQTRTRHGAATDEAFGLWRRRSPDSVAYQRQLRKEWDRPTPARAKRRA
ncbi:MAG: ribbon-helix-helix protein, CopG family [Acidobacteriota bacterium]